MENAKAGLAGWQKRFDDYSGNNPDKYQSDITAAKANVREIEGGLKDDGAIPTSEHEKTERALDRAFPNARSKEIVEFAGKRYKRRFTPLGHSRSGKSDTVWGKSWDRMDD